MGKEIPGREFADCMEGRPQKGHASEESRNLTQGGSATYIVNSFTGLGHAVFVPGKVYDTYRTTQCIQTSMRPMES